VKHVDRLKLVFAVVGLALFFYSIRIGSNALRWTGVGFVVAAWGLRFARRPPQDNDDEPQLPSEIR
jgi:hypothetical protein